MRPFVVFFLALLVFAPPARALEIPPSPTQWFTDRAGMVSGSDAQAINEKLRSFEQQTGIQFIVYTLPSLEGESMEDFTIRAAEKWKVGQKKYDNGLILFVFRDERRIRIEVAYGLEGTVTDAYSSRVINQIIGPRFKQGDFAGGLDAGIDALIGKLTGKEVAEPLGAPTRAPAGGAQPQLQIPSWMFLLLIAIFFFVIVPMLRRSRGGSSGCGGCIFPFFFPGGGITFGGGGGGFSGGGFGGGGFSGGGGSFGGGGASGGW